MSNVIVRSGVEAGSDAHPGRDAPDQALGLVRQKPDGPEPRPAGFGPAG